MNEEKKQQVSIIIPIYNEEGCIRNVLNEVISCEPRVSNYEILAVDDGSTDGTPEILHEFEEKHHQVRVIRNDRNCGQSAAVWVGINAAHGGIIVMMDADGQNVPTDISRCVDALRDADVCCGYRAVRRDTFRKRIGSKFANWVRRGVLNDKIRDTGCSMKAFRAEYLHRLQYWNGMHRFLPMLCEMEGARIVQIPVQHRQRFSGGSKYTNLGRLKTTFYDTLAVRWMMSRSDKFPMVLAALRTYQSSRGGCKELRGVK